MVASEEAATVYAWLAGMWSAFGSISTYWYGDAADDGDTSRAVTEYCIRPTCALAAAPT